MDNIEPHAEDLTDMRTLRLRLRALADDRIALMETLPPPTSWLELQRQFKAIEAADRTIVALYSAPSKPRATRSKRDDRPAEKATAVVDAAPPAPAPAPSPAPSPASSDADVVAMATEKVIEAIDETVHRCAERAGVWPDGAPFHAGKSGWRQHTLTQGLALPDDDRDPTLWLGEQILERVNAIARHHGRRTGLGLDNLPYRDGDSGPWRLSANFTGDHDEPADGEIPGPSCLPWWIVRAPT